jgi:hypothetical protein
MRYGFKTLLPSVPLSLRGGKSSIQRLIYIAIVLLGTSARAASDRTTMREILGGYLKDRSPVFYSECMGEFGKAMVIVETKTGSFWFYEFDRDWFYNSSEVTIEGNSFTTEGFGGIYSRESTHKIAAALLKAPFTFLMPDQLDSLLTSKPRAKCPVLDPKELSQPPASKK